MSKRIEGIAMDKNGNPLKEIFITLKNEDGVVIDSVTTEDEGYYSFFADDQQNFTLIGTNKKYLEGSTFANTWSDDYVVIANVTMLEEVKEEVVTEETADVQPEIIVNFISIVFKPIYFEFNKYNINSAAAKVLDKLVVEMNKNPEMVVEIRSYADCRDTESYNQTLSQNRANATIDYIQDRITNPSRISGDGYGESEPVNGCVGEGDVVSDCTEDQHSKNRRTEFVVVPTRKVSSL